MGENLQGQSSLKMEMLGDLRDKERQCRAGLKSALGERNGAQDDEKENSNRVQTEGDGKKNGGVFAFPNWPQAL